MWNPVQYSTRDWLRGEPLIDGIKLLRNSVAERLYRMRRPPELDGFLAANAHLRGQTIAVSVAFNTPWAIGLLLRTARLNLPDATLVIVDNSTDAAARDAIRRMCADAGVAYLPLPPSPIRHFSRSHGVALTWTYHNLVKPLRPAVFAFLDHDLFPLKPVRIADLVRNQPVYGRSARSPVAWSIWAGYCVFDFLAVSGYRLDFNTDRPRGLDTGGRNWKHVYRHLDASRIRLAELRNVETTEADTGRRVIIEVMDGFIHVRHASFSEAPGGAPGRSFYDQIVRRLEAGERLDHLL